MLKALLGRPIVTCRVRLIQKTKTCYSISWHQRWLRGHFEVYHQPFSLWQFRRSWLRSRGSLRLSLAEDAGFPMALLLFAAILHLTRWKSSATVLHHCTTVRTLGPEEKETGRERTSSPCTKTGDTFCDAQQKHGQDFGRHFLLQSTSRWREARWQSHCYQKSWLHFAKCNKRLRDAFQQLLEPSFTRVQKISQPLTESSVTTTLLMRNSSRESSFF